METEYLYLIVVLSAVVMVVMFILIRRENERIEATVKEMCDALLVAANRPVEAVAPRLDVTSAHYHSTACQHELHNECRDECRWCHEPCKCDCHDLYVRDSEKTA